MKNLLLLLSLAVSLLFAGCVSSTTKLRIGMTRDEVVAVMGQPSTVAAMGQNEDLNYTDQEYYNGHFSVNRPYIVRLVGGKVESFGFVGQISPIRTPYATPNRTAELRLGMTKAEAIAVMGEPISVSAEGRTELLNYSLSEWNGVSTMAFVRPYGVRLVDGKVDAFGYHSTAPGARPVSTGLRSGPVAAGEGSSVRIVSVEPGVLIPGKPAEVKLKIRYQLQAPGASVRVSFNTEGPKSFRSVLTKPVSGTTGEVELSCEFTPRDWGEMTPCTVMAVVTPEDRSQRPAIHTREIELKR